MTDKDSAETTKLYNADNNSYYFTNLGHVNDMDVWGIDGNSHLFVTSTNEGDSAIVRLKREGNNLTQVASYRLTYNGADICATALAIKSVSGAVITIITKLGQTLYTGAVSTAATSATIELKKLCVIDKTQVTIQAQWYYTNGSSSGWYAEGAQPSGWTKDIYSDGCKVAKTTSVDGDVVIMYARWVANC